MANTSVDGLISGLGTSDLINQLMQLERQPKVRLQAQRTALEGISSAYTALNGKLDGVLQAASALSAISGWQAMRATTSDSTRLTATAGSAALAGDLTVSVEQLAVSHTIVSELAVSGLDAVVAGGPITFTVGGVAQDPIDAGDGTLSSVVSAINAAGVGVRAAAVQVTPGQYRLQLSAAATGTAAAFTVDATSLAALADPDEASPDPEAFDVLAIGADAEIKVGGAGGYSVWSATNTFSELLPGVSMTAVRADPGVAVTVSVATDVDALAGKVEQLVAAVNGALRHIESATAYDTDKGTKGPLLGDGLTRRIQQNLYTALRVDLPGRSLGDLGLKLGEDGLVLDRAALVAAYTADPDMVIEAFTGAATAATDDGLATKLAAVGAAASDESTGLISVAITSKGDQAALVDRQIDAWDVRLARRETTLRRQFAAMEAALGALQNQSSWLAGQIGSLPSWEH